MKSHFRRVESHKASLWKGGSPLLGNLALEITERCNNNCIHCYINLPPHDPNAKERELSTEEIGSILKEATSLGCLTVRFTGGEPLLREDFEDLYILSRKLGLKVIIFTNATLITPRLAKLFARMPLLHKIEVTVYGMSKKSYEAVTRTPGSFEAAWRGMGLLLEENVPFVVKGAFLPPNRGEMEEFESWAATITWMDHPPPYSMFFDLRCRREPEEKNRLIRGLRLSPREGVKILTRRREEYFRNMKEFCSKFMYPSGDSLFSCDAGVCSGCVDAYGQFQPCIMLRHPATICSLKTNSLKDILTNFFPEVRQMRASNPIYLARCARCFLKGLCEQCPAKSWMEHGTLDSPVEYLCEIAHAQARYLGLLKDNEMSWEVIDWEERISRWLKDNQH
ncbi:radical SAM protein [Candidatus Poribacteria bacterium]